jgi:archaellum component FlaC
MKKMTDIVERLRDAEKYVVWDEELYTEAANEIERLRKENENQTKAIWAKDVEIERLRDELDTWMSVFPDIAPESVLPDRSNLEKEIERLREALRKIVERDAGVNKFGEKDMSTLGWIAYNALREKE